MVIGDLGLAKSINEIRTSTMLTGTLNYLSPECFCGRKISCESDIWGFGCILYELVEFKKAFEGNSLFAIMKYVIDEPLPELEDKILDLLLKK